jgi:hypothetical protein
MKIEIDTELLDQIITTMVGMSTCLQREESPEESAMIAKLETMLMEKVTGDGPQNP